MKLLLLLLSLMQAVSVCSQSRVSFKNKVVLTDSNFVHVYQYKKIGFGRWKLDYLKAEGYSSGRQTKIFRKLVKENTWTWYNEDGTVSAVDNYCKNWRLGDYGDDRIKYSIKISGVSTIKEYDYKGVLSSIY